MKRPWRRIGQRANVPQILNLSLNRQDAHGGRGHQPSTLRGDDNGKVCRLDVRGRVQSGLCHGARFGTANRDSVDVPLHLPVDLPWSVNCKSIPGWTTLTAGVSSAWGVAASGWNSAGAA